MIKQPWTISDASREAVKKECQRRLYGEKASAKTVGAGRNILRFANRMSMESGSQRIRNRQQYSSDGPGEIRLKMT